MPSIYEERKEGRKQKPRSPLGQAANSFKISAAGIWIAIVAVLFVVVSSTIWSVSTIKEFMVKGRAASHAPVTLIDEVERLPAPSWKTIPVVLPYKGALTIDINVLRGNAVDVILTTPDQLATMKKGEWNKLKVCAGINETGTKSYTHTGYLNRGGYYLVLGDAYLGEPSTAASEISVKVSLTP